MTQHFTRNTISAAFHCPKCGRVTQHRIDGRRKGPCLGCIDRLTFLEGRELDDGHPFAFHLRRGGAGESTGMGPYPQTVGDVDGAGESGTAEGGVSERKEFPLNTANLAALLDVLPQLGKIEAAITVRVSIDELQKLPREKCKAFLEGIAAVCSAQATIARTDKD